MHPRAKIGGVTCRRPDARQGKRAERHVNARPRTRTCGVFVVVNTVSLRAQVAVPVILTILAATFFRLSP